MNVWFDLCHIPQYNFYKWVICRLAEEGNTVFVTVLDRGKLIKIVNKEIGHLANIHIFVIGKHRSKKWSAIIDANLIRNIKLIRWVKGRKVDIGFSNGYQLALVGWLKRFPTYSFDDDPQTFDYWPKILLNTECNYCIYHYDRKLSPKAHILPVLKEWAYLAPGYFEPDISVLDEYGIKPKEYLFMREVSVGTVNYAGQEYGAVLDIKDRIPAKFKVLFSLEDKSRRDLYPKDWILLREPLKDIHSLMYYSAGLISSGDSMAREAALLGVPSYYLGIRYDMPANATASEVAELQNARTMELSEWIESLLSESAGRINKQEISRKDISSHFIDINQYILNLCKR